MNLLYIFVVQSERRCRNEMNYKKRLISQIFRLLSLIETPTNQSIIRQIEGLLNALKEETE